MTIQVELVDGSNLRVVPLGLDLLLERRLVRRFRRSSGWAEVGIDPLRAADSHFAYTGPERRQPR